MTDDRWMDRVWERVRRMTTATPPPKAADRRRMTRLRREVRRLATPPPPPVASPKPKGGRHDR